MLEIILKKCNLSYSDIDMNALYKLIKILNKNISETNNYLIMMNEPHLKGKNRNIIFKNSKLIFAALRVKGEYFDDREAITFNQDEFIDTETFVNGGIGIICIDCWNDRKC